jgi:hypothetical protein
MESIGVLCNAEYSKCRFSHKTEILCHVVGFGRLRLGARNMVAGYESSVTQPTKLEPKNIGIEMIICIHPSQLPHSPVYEVPFIFYRRRLRYGGFIVGLNALIGIEASLIQLIGLDSVISAK